MKKYGKRIVAFALAMVVALGSVCYKPPKAEAFLGGMLANMCLSVYMTATGISLIPDNATAERLVSAIDDLIPDFVKDYAQEVGEFTSDMFKSVIEQHTVFQTGGKLQVAHNAAALMGRFSGWLINKYDLVDSEGVVATKPALILPNTVSLDSSESEGGSSDSGGTETSSASAPAVPDWMGLIDMMQEIENSNVQYNYYLLAKKSSGKLLFAASNRPFYYGTYNENLGVHTTSYIFKAYIPSGGTEWVNDGYKYNGGSAYWDLDNYTILASNHTIYDVTTDDAPPYFEPVHTVSVSTDYAAAPTVDEDEVIVLDTGLTYEDEDSYIDSVLGSVASGTLSPSYTIEDSTTGDVTVPGEGEDTEDETVGILDWTKKIWQSVTELPQSIADAVANVFVPSAEYMAALPETVTATFDNRTGFLTYPVSVLYDFADRLTAGQQDFILEWPTVNEPYSGGQLMAAGQFNVSKYVRDNDFASDIYTIYQWVVGAYLTFLFFGLCRRKYNSVIGDRLGG